MAWPGVLSHVHSCATPWPVARQAPLSMGSSRQACWSGLPFPTPGHLPDTGIGPVSLSSLALADGFFTTAPHGNPMTNTESVLKTRDIPLPTKVHIVIAMVFPVVLYGCEGWTIKNTEHQWTDAFWLWCWRRLWESLGLHGDPASPSLRKAPLNIHWKDWFWSWRLRAGGEGGDRG